MKRRNFLAVLLAPLLARFARKPKLGERVFPDDLLKNYTVGIDTGGESVSVTTWFAPDGKIYHVFGDRYIAISHHYGERPPVMRWTKAHDPNEWPWEEPKA